ncbi:heterokaryon incompatibility protein-domain-containing protein [Immersiella caudata]|uniref:Heterokaryon incompatibility protein-domain-containing protein n=1 Tax=Immersiella caudata TaxID=314043 RepID=A0AA40BZ91_9PEZI|nr:heterokaryon incompatibility protein-domain-containing protein [Immersiella caudata]
MSGLSPWRASRLDLPPLFLAHWGRPAPASSLPSSAMNAPYALPRLPSQVYQYRPLGSQYVEVRILKLHAGCRGTPITATITHVALRDSSLNYQALSYVWGDKGDLSGTILIDGLPHPRRLQRNLELALRQIRDTQADTALWIDAICINQDDYDEKGKQVALMGEIYTRARSVLSWVGPEQDGSDTAMELMADGERFLSLARNRQLSSPDISAVLALLYRAYWTRVWIVQEVYFARSLTIKCGTKSIPADIFQYCVGVVTFQLNTQFQDTETIRDKSADNPASAHIRLFGIQTLRAWLDRCVQQGFKATDPRDYIYALAGVSRDGRYGEIIPNYRGTVREALLQAAPLVLHGPTPAYYQETPSDHFLEHPVFRYAEMMGIEVDNELVSDLYACARSPPRTQHSYAGGLRNMSGPGFWAR